MALTAAWVDHHAWRMKVAALRAKAQARSVEVTQGARSATLGDKPRATSGEVVAMSRNQAALLVRE